MGSTFIKILGGLETITSGTVLFQDKDIGKLTRKEIDLHRSETIGFVFQDFGLMDALTVEEKLLKNVPDWWGDDNKEIYDNLIFIMPPLSYEEFYNEIGNPKAEYEKVHNYKNVVFWSFNRKYYQKTNWWSKTASANISDKITIRTANTVRKIVSM